MNLLIDEPLPVPLRRVEGGTLRVGHTRVTLDSVIASYQEGCTPEETVQQYPVLDLADVYLVFAFYLRHKDWVEAYLAPRRAEVEAFRQESQASGREYRERLLARQRAGQA